MAQIKDFITIIKSLFNRSNNGGCFSKTPGSKHTVNPDIVQVSYCLEAVSMRSLLSLSGLKVAPTDMPPHWLCKCNMWRF